VSSFKLAAGASGGLPAQGPIAQNEPNLPGGAGRDGASGTWDAGQMRKTNPISAVAAVGSPRYSSIPSFQSSGAGRGAIVQNEPNSAGRPGPRRAKCAKRTQFPAGPGGTRPGGRGTRVKCAKRTQFPAAEIPHHSSIPLFQRSNLMPIVQNEPNFRRPRYPTIPVFHYSNVPIRCRSCETKPIAPWKVSGEDAQPTKSRGPIVRNEPNLARLGPGRVSDG
jgi:hypothetical protein